MVMQPKLIRISDYQARKRREAYRRQHRWCWIPILRDGKWRICGIEPAICEHIARGRRIDYFEHQRNYFPCCDFPHGNHHQGWKHAGSPESPGEAEARLHMLALKVIAGETNYAEAEQLLKGRSWYNPELPEQDSVEKAVAFKVIKWQAHFTKKDLRRAA